VVDRATAKDVDTRYMTIAEMLDDLEASLDIEAGRTGGRTTGEATAVLDSIPKDKRRHSGRKGGGASTAALVMGLIGVGLIIVALVIGQDKLDIGGGSKGNGNTISIQSVQAFDPSDTGGDDEEHSDQVKLAIDGNPTATAWPTETYDAPDFSGAKPGVGLVVDAGKPVTAKAVELRSTLAGYDAEIRVAPGAGSPPESLDGWKLAGTGNGLGTRSKIDLSDPQSSRFYLVWITQLAQADGGYRVELSNVELLD
jgi:hypothetical protein